MALQGTIRRRDGKSFFVYTTTEDSSPTRVSKWWCMSSVLNVPDGTPAVYDAGLTHFRDTHGSTSVRSDGSAQAAYIEREPVPPPETRRPVRWQWGRWETYTKKLGWTPA